MDFANSLLQLVNNLWGLASRPLGFICNLKDNVNSLRNTTDELKAKSETVLARVEREERGGVVQRTKEVAYWLDTVQKLVGRVDQILREAGECDQIKCLSRCLPSNCWSSYKLGKRVDQMLNEVRELQAKELEFGVVTSTLPPPPVLDMPMDETVGPDISKFNKVWKWVVDEKQVNQDKIQDTIRGRLGIKDEHWERWSWEDRVYHLCQALKRKKFVLLLDDLWARLDLSKIGVPCPGLEDGSKVVLTTRLKPVCDHMRADKTLEVLCLRPKEALELFEKNVGKSLVDCHQEIRDLAKDIAEECKGLPLALITVGRAMARKDSPGEWRHALTTLRNKPHKLQGMVEDVYHVLEFSYNSLDDSTRQDCFLYCCLFPEDYTINADQLIELWIGEGLLRDTNDVYSMRDEGESVLGDLNRACLLESGHDDDGRYVKMHDVIRDMATWIARDHGQRENKLLVIEKDEDMSEEMISKWGEAKKVSIWGKWIRNINQIPSRCSQLETLFVRETRVTGLPSGFFDSMTTCLAVLNLSDNEHIKSFPEGICNLINLQYLNLSGTCISELPKGIKNLTRLRWLLLDNMLGRNILIPTGAITSLPLNVFSQWESKVNLDEFGLVKEEETVEELGCMHHLTDLSIGVCESSSAQKIFQSSNLRRRERERALIIGMVT
ncbi:hypothetical protein NL676_026378 [Syzygium grande]|nr:hypothetical protein NL676_026378 [Syzygium grande]